MNLSGVNVQKVKKNKTNSKNYEEDINLLEVSYIY